LRESEGLTVTRNLISVRIDTLHDEVLDSGSNVDAHFLISFHLPKRINDFILFADNTVKEIPIEDPGVDIDKFHIVTLRVVVDSLIISLIRSLRNVLIFVKFVF
jgi:hypothetical protein